MVHTTQYILWTMVLFSCCCCNLMQSKRNSNKRTDELFIINEAMNIAPDENDNHTLSRSKRFIDPFSIIGVGLGFVSMFQGIESDKKSEENFRKVFDGINKNYNAIKNVEEKVDRNFVALKLVSEMVSETLSAVEKTRIEMNQGFNRVLESIRNSRIEPTVSKLNNFIQYFSNEKERIKNLPQNEYITKLQEQNGILLHLKDSRTPKENTVHTLLYDIINQRYAIPQDSNDKVAFDSLYALYYGTQTYVSVMFFLLEQYSYLADYHYENGNLEKYNQCFDFIQTNFQDFKHSLIGSTSNSNASVIDSVINVLNTVQSKNFINDTGENSFKLLSERVKSLMLIKHHLEVMELPIIADVPGQLIGKPKFKKQGINTPIGEWKAGTKVCYAIQFKNNGTYSKVGEWSDPLTVSGEANPFLNIPVDPKRRTRLIFRKFNNDKPQLVGVLENKYQTRFRDINRDIYNSALNFNEEIAINEVNVLIRNGADVNAVFDKGRRAIHAAAQGDNPQLALDLLISNNATNINAKDKNGYTPIYIAAEAGHDDFVELLIDHGADVNVRTNSDNRTSLHVAAYKGYVSTVKILMQSNAIDVNAKDKEGFTPLHSAVFGGVPVVNALISNNNIDINAKSKEGLTTLHLASISNHHDVAEALLKSTNRVDINAGTKGNLTALHFASLFGHLEIVKFLADRNETDVNAESINNWTPLHFSISLKKEEIVSELLKINNTNVNVIGEGKIAPLHIAAITGQEGVALGLLEKEAAIEEKTKDGFTALHLAAMHDNQEVVSTLIYYGANIEAKNTNGLTPLNLAIANCKLDIVKHLVEKFNADVNTKDNNDQTPLHYTAIYGCLDIAKYLIEKNAEFNSSDLLFQAANEGHLDIVKYMVDEKNVDVNIKNNDGRTPLHLAAKYGHLDIVKYLIENRKAELNMEDSGGSSPLHYAASEGQLKVVKFLIEKGADLNAGKNRVGTPLHCAAKEGKLDVVKYFIEKEAHVNLTDYYVNTFFYLAVENGHLDVVEYLVSGNKIDVNTKDNERGVHYRYIMHDTHTILYWAVCDAVRYGKLDILKYFVNEKNADIDISVKNSWFFQLSKAARNGHLNVVKYLVEKRNIDINNGTGSHDGPLESAARNGTLDVVTYLVERGADVNIKGSLGGVPLHWAIFGNNFNVVKYLVEKTNADINAGDEYGRTPLYYTAIYGRFEIAKYLIEKNADLNVSALLFKAAEEGGLNIVEYMINEKNADVNVRNSRGETPLHGPARYGRIIIVKYLIEKNAHVNVKDNDDQTPLHMASENFYLDVVKYLVEKGADINVQDKNGQTPLHRVTRRYYPKVINTVKYLVDQGADLNAKNNDGKTPLHLASRSGTFEVVKYLVEKGADTNVKDSNNKTPMEAALECSNCGEKVSFLRNAQRRVRHRRHKHHHREHLQERNRFSAIDARSRRSITKESDNPLRNDEVGYITKNKLREEQGSSPVDVGVYYESMCPDSELFVQQQLLPTYMQMQEYMNVELIPYGNAHYSGQRDQYTFTCQHGPEECYGNMVQTCYINLVNNTESQLKFLNCAFNSPSQSKSLERCVDSKDLRRQVKKCVTGTLGPNLEYEMAKKTDALQPPHNFIPWITINGKGGREITDKACDDLMTVVCDALLGTKPELCTQNKLSLFKRFRNYYL